MITVIAGLFFGASFVTSTALIAACMLSGRVQAEVELVPVSAESLRGIAEVELPKQDRRRQTRPAPASI